MRTLHRDATCNPFPWRLPRLRRTGLDHPEVCLLQPADQPKWHGVSVTIRPGQVLETRLCPNAPSVFNWHVSHYLSSFHRSRTRWLRDWTLAWSTKVTGKDWSGMQGFRCSYDLGGFPPFHNQCMIDNPLSVRPENVTEDVHPVASFVPRLPCGTVNRAR